MEMGAFTAELLMFFSETKLKSMSPHLQNGLTTVCLSGQPLSQLVQQQLGPLRGAAQTHGCISDAHL